jgi:hypothetical protein
MPDAGSTTFVTTGTSSEAAIAVPRRTASVGHAGVIRREELRDQQGPQQRASEALERAVYAYFRAVRSLGQTVVNTEDVAKALRVPLADVHVVIRAMKVKRAKPGR